MEVGQSGGNSCTKRATIDILKNLLAGPETIMSMQKA